MKPSSQIVGDRPKSLTEPRAFLIDIWPVKDSWTSLGLSARSIPFLWSFGRLRGLKDDWKIWIMYFSGTDMCAARMLLMNERSSPVSVASPSSSILVKHLHMQCILEF